MKVKSFLAIGYLLYLTDNLYNLDSKVNRLKRPIFWETTAAAPFYFEYALCIGQCINMLGKCRLGYIIISLTMPATNAEGKEA